MRSSRKKILLIVCFCYLLLSFSPLLSFQSNSCIEQAKQQATSNKDYKTIALECVGITDNGNNTGQEVSKFQNFVGIPHGSPWCAAFVSYVLNEANVIYPKIKSGLARRFKTRKSIKAIRIFQGVLKAPQNGLAIWQRGSTIHGHIGFIISSDQSKRFTTVEGNTRIHGHIDGVAVKSRKIQPYNYFRIVWITPVRQHR